MTFRRGSIALLFSAACSTYNAPHHDAGVSGDAGMEDAGEVDAGQLPSLTVTSISPTQGAAGDSFTVQGGNIAANAVVFFGSAQVVNPMTSAGGASISGVVPVNTSGSSSVSVTVQNAPGIEATLANAFTYAPVQITSCQLGQPTTARVTAGSTTPALNATMSPAAVESSVTGQVGYGPAATAPSLWTWSSATAGSDGAFSGTLTPATQGAYAFAFRFTADGTTYTYCDSAGDAMFNPANAGALTVDALPTVTSVTPDQGLAGGQAVIAGSGLVSGVAVYFGSVQATIVTLATDGTSATVTIPAGSGTVAVTVQLDGQTFTAPGMFIYNPVVQWCEIDSPTTVTALVGSPSSALFVDVYQPGLTPNNGTGVTGQVGFGATGTTPDSTWNWSAASYAHNINNNDVYTATLTATTAGTYSFAFRFTLDGTDYVYCDSAGDAPFNPANAGTFTAVAAPTITSVQPATGVAGDTVTITGTGFVSGTSFSFGTSAATNVMLSADGTTATVTVPAGSGVVPVSVMLAGDTIAWSGQFTYENLVGWCVLDMPTSAQVIAGAATPTLMGEVYEANLTPNNGSGITGQVGFGAPTADPSTWTWSSTTFDGLDNNNDVFMGTLTPTVAGSYAYAFRFTLDGVSYAYCDSFGLTHGFVVADAGALTVLNTPTITGVSPTHAVAGSTVTITGTGFVSGTVFNFGTAPATNVMLAANGTSATMTLPPGSGTVAVNAMLLSATATWSGMFTYDTPLLTIASLNPTFASVLGGQQLTMTGTGFLTGTPSVTIGGQTASIVGSPTATQIVVTTPALAAGSQTVVVTSGAGMAQTTLPYALNFTITPDGNLSDWPAAALVGSETTTSEWGTADVLSDLYLGYDSTNFYIGIQGTAESQNAIIGYLSMSNLPWGSNDIKDTLTDSALPSDAIGHELTSGFIAPTGFLTHYGFGLFGTAPNITDSVQSGSGVRRFLNPANFDWVNATVAQSVNNSVNGIEFAIPWQTTGTGADLFIPYVAGQTPVTVSAFVRLVCCSGSQFPSQSLPSDPNLQPSVTNSTTRATVSTTATIEVY